MNAHKKGTHSKTETSSMFGTLFGFTDHNICRQQAMCQITDVPNEQKSKITQSEAEIYRWQATLLVQRLQNC